MAQLLKIVLIRLIFFQTELAEVAGNTMVKRRLYFYKLEFVKEGGVDYEYHCAVVGGLYSILLMMLVKKLILSFL